MRFVKKPVQIEAERYDADKIHTLSPEFRAAVLDVGIGDEHHRIIRTLEGDHRLTDGDWIIRGVKGEFYPCKPDIFALVVVR